MPAAVTEGRRLVSALKPSMANSHSTETVAVACSLRVERSLAAHWCSRARSYCSISSSEILTLIERTGDGRVFIVQYEKTRRCFTGRRRVKSMLNISKLIGILTIPQSGCSFLTTVGESNTVALVMMAPGERAAERAACVRRWKRKAARVRVYGPEIAGGVQ